MVVAEYLLSHELLTAEVSGERKGFLEKAPGSRLASGRAVIGKLLLIIDTISRHIVRRR